MGIYCDLLERMSFIGLTRQVFYYGIFGMDFELKPDQPER
jgi:hypothetical protein